MCFHTCSRLFPLGRPNLLHSLTIFSTPPEVSLSRDVSIPVYVCVLECFSLDCLLLLLLLLLRWCESILVILYTSPIPFPVVILAASGWVKHSLMEGWSCWGWTGCETGPQHPLKGSGMSHSLSLPSLLSHSDAGCRKQYELSGCLLDCSTLLSGHAKTITPSNGSVGRNGKTEYFYRLPILI